MTVSHLFPNKMAVTMALFWVSLVLSVIGSNAAGEFSILHSPKSLKFSGSSNISESSLKEVFSAALGLSVDESSDWKGLYVTDPFYTPEAVVEVYVDGVSSIHDSIGPNAKTFPLDVDQYEPDTFDAIKHRIQQRFSTDGNKLVNIKLSEPNQVQNDAGVFADLKDPKVVKQSLSHLKNSVEEDHQFLQELQKIKDITERFNNGLIKPDKIVDFYNFRFTSLHALSDIHGRSSLQTKEAKKLLGEALQELTKALVKTYDGSVLVTAVVNDVAHSRRVPRAAENETPTSATQDPELDGEAYSADYPAIFNIVLWFGIVFAFTLIAIVYAIMDMDPGRDSIIYRMTSTRMKKDN